MDDRQQMYSQLEEARKELLASVDGLTPEQMTVPMLEDWSAKDILAHVSSWEEFALPDLRRMGRGHMPALLGFREEQVDDWNRMLMSLRRNFPLDQVMSELEEYRKATIAALDALPDERLAQGQFPWIMAQITVHHEREHAGHIVEWRKKEGLK